MTDPNLEADLQRALTEGTDHLRSPDLADRALAGAARTRTRRTTLGALALVVLVGAGVTWAAQDRVPRADVVDTPSPTPTSTPSVVDTDPATQPIWDPFTIVDAPRADTVLPVQLDPPADPPAVAEAPLPNVLVAWPEMGRDLRLLGSNGEWRRVPGTATAISGTLRDVVDPAISPDATQVAMATDVGILVVTVTTGEERVIPWPPALAGPFDTRPELLWRPDGEGFVVLHWKRPWLVGLDGEATVAPFGGPFGGGVMVDPDTGTVRERRSAYKPLRTWESDGGVSVVPLGGYGERFVTRFDRVAYVGNPGVQPTGALKSGPVVVDSATGKIVAYAPIRDRNSVYSDNGHLTTMGFLDEETVLLLVTPRDLRTMDPEDGTTHLVAWHFETGEFERLTEGGPAMRSVAVATPALASP